MMREKIRKIVLFNPPYAPQPIPQTPLSIMAASSILNSQGYRIEIINGSLEAGFIEKVIEKCDNALCLGISAMTGYQLRGGLAASLAVKNKYPGLPIIWGGWHGSILSKETASDNAVDVVTRGQGEKTFAELIKALDNGEKDLSKIKGIVYKNEGQVIINEERAFEDINNFPPLPYYLVDIEKLLKARAWIPEGRFLEYVSSQGCPNRCTFCVEPLVMHRHWSGISAERVVSEWSFLSHKYNLEAIHLLDSNFFVSRERVEAISLKLIKLRLPITWHNANATVDTLVPYDRQMWQLLAQSGCRSILVGAESGSPEKLKLVDKKYTVEDILKIAKISQQFGIRISFSLMTGFPPEGNTAEIMREFKATMRLIYEILRINKNNGIKLFLYTPYTGSPLYFKSLDHGLEVPKNLNAWGNFELVNITTPWVSRQFKKKVDLARMFAIPYFQKGYTVKKGWRNFSRYLLTLISGWRLKHGLFVLPLEYRFLYRRLKKKGLIQE